MKRKIIFIILMFLFIINISALVSLAYSRWIKSSYSYSKQDAMETLNGLQQKMALNQQQLQKMKNLRVTLEDEIESMRKQIHEKRQALITEIRKSNPDLTDIDNIIDEISFLQSQIQKKTMRNLMRDKKVLTPSQQTRYFTMFEDYVRGMGMGRGRRVRGRKGPAWRRNQ